MFTWIFSALSITGAVLNARGNIKGFYIWIVGNMCWVVYDAIIGEYAQSFLFLFFTGVCVYGIRQWKKRKIGTSK